MMEICKQPVGTQSRVMCGLRVLCTVCAIGLNGALVTVAQGQADRPGKTAAKATESSTKTDAGRSSTTASSPFSKAIDHAQKRCVRIYGAGIGRERGYATGLIVSNQGHILTSQGIYLSGERLRVAMRDGRIYLASIVRRSETLQAAILKIDAKTPDFFTLPEKLEVQKGDWVVAVSNAFKVADRNEDLSVNLGVVSMRAKLDAKHRTQDIEYEGDVLMVDAITSNPGAPGGALMTMDGQLAGMIGKLIMSKSTNTRLNYAVPSDQLRLFVGGGDLAKATKTQSAEKPYLGIRLFTLSGKRAPAYIDRVISGSPAHEAGLRRDDLVMFVNGQVVRSIRAYDEIFGSLLPKTEITIVFKRGNLIKTANVVVGKKEAAEK